MAATVDQADVSQAVLQSVRTGLYPESEAIAVSQLSSSALPALQNELRKGRDEIEVRYRRRKQVGRLTYIFSGPSAAAEQGFGCRH